MIFDTHAHYDDEAFNEDREEVLLKMQGMGVGTIVDIGESMESSHRALELAKAYDFMYCAVGVHPSKVENLTEADMEWIEETVKNEKKAVAIGEIGLDYHWPEPSLELQKKWFERQLRIAIDTNTPVVIHSRNAAKDTMDMIRAAHEAAISEGKELSGVMHCYSYSAEQAKEYVSMGFYLGIGGVLTYKNEKKLMKVVKAVPMENLVLETDCPYLTPEPHRGERNISWYLPEVIKKIAEFREMDTTEVEKKTEENARRLYKFEK